MAINKKTRLIVHQKFDGHCAYCGEEIEYSDMQVDHIIPKDRYNYDGERKADDLTNLHPSCRGCNFYKSTFLIEEFRNQMKTIHERISKPFINRLGVKYSIIILKPFDGIFYFEKKH